MTENSEAADLGKSMSLSSSLAMHQSNVGIENPGAAMAFRWPWQRDKRPPENHQDPNHVRAGIEDHVQNHVRNQDQNRDPSHVQSGIRGHNRVHQSRGRIRRDHNLETDRARDPGIGARVVQDHGGKQLGIDD